MYHIAICDDESLYTDKIAQITFNICHSLSIPVTINTYNNSQNLLFDLEAHKYYDIYFLDIEMPGLHGMDLASSIRKFSKEAVLVLVTAHLEYAIDAFPLSVSHYILKSTIDKRLPPALKDIFHFLLLQDNKYYIIDHSRKYQKIPCKDIIYIYKNQKNAIFVLTDSEIKERVSLETVFSHLPSDDFIYIERGFIVNFLHIMKLENCELLLRNGEKLHVSRSHLPNVKKEITLYWGNHI